MWGRREWLRTVLAVAPRSLFANPVSYIQQIEKWRRDREAALKADDGWLTVAGLHWLQPGANRFNELTGIEFHLQQGKVRARIDPMTGAKVNGAAAREAELKPDVPGPADLITFGTRTLFVIERSGRYGIRVRDTESRFRKNFRGLTWYPVKPEYRVAARFQRHPSPLTVSIPTILGFDEVMTSPGLLHFTLEGKAQTLRPVLSGGRLFLIFKDTTAGKKTYPAGRFLYADLPESGNSIDLDFNKAYNPPCAYTPYATCPLPPPENRLGTAIEAGELNYHHD